MLEHISVKQVKQVFHMIDRLTWLALLSATFVYQFVSELINSVVPKNCSHALGRSSNAQGLTESKERTRCLTSMPSMGRCPSV